MLLKVQNKKSFPLLVVKTLLKKISSFFEQIKKELIQKKILDIIQKLAFSTDVHHWKAKQDLMVIKLTINNIHLNSSFTLFSSNFSGSRNYVNML